ncbi:MAG: DUF3048 domain-containing protein [Blautia sp.]|nr:DUF3048 domain-containing protein [Blautia sp.]
MKKKQVLSAIVLSAALMAASAFSVSVFAEETPDNQYRSELTNEWIDSSLRDQRPVAVLVDNEKTALDHFGINQADIVYELMNSTANGRITRLMAVMKDWQNIEQLGSIRSARPTNFMLAAEYNAILVHDGGPFYIDEYVAKPYTNNLSGGFARFSNGKATEFTEYVTAQDYKNPNTGRAFQGLLGRIEKADFGPVYNEYYSGPVFAFADDEVDLSAYSSAVSASDIALPFPHNSSKLTYNEETGTYDYAEYGAPHVDALDQSVTTFKNVILQDCDFTELDPNGYMIYELLTSEAHDGYYITDGEAIPITWEKAEEAAPTVYKNAETGETITLNTGKTYVGLVPSDVWDQLNIQ